MTKLACLIAVLVIALSSATMFAFECPAGTVEYNGNCYRDFKPSDTDNIPEVKPSDERVHSEKLPSYERPGIHADTPQSLIAQDALQDTQRDAAIAEGKKAAGIK
jgi:hypothetical protein